MKRLLKKFILSIFIINLISLVLSFNKLNFINISIASNNENNNIVFNDNSNVNFEINADACSLLDVDSDKFLYEKNSSKKMYPASTTKLMTAIIVIENCNDLSQKVKISYYAIHSVPYSYSIANLYPNEEFSIMDLLESMLIASANDSAFALAEYIANNGNNYSLDSSNNSEIAFKESIQKFATLMNKKAVEIGCTSTNFVNPNGVHNENHYSTAKDLALIGKYAYKNSIIRNIVVKQSGFLDNSNVYNGEKRSYSSTNLLLNKKSSGYYTYANGLKTGYTDLAQYCIIASAKKDERNLIAVVLHSENIKDSNISRESDCKKLFEYGFNYFTNIKLVSSNQIVKKMIILNGSKNSRNLNALCKDDISVLIEKGQVLDVTPEIKINKFVAPISKGEIIGKITYTIYGSNYSSDLIASNDVISINYNFFIVILICMIIILFLIYLFIEKFSNKNKK